MPVYQPKLLAVAQVNVQFCFEFGLRLTTIRSPTNFFVVIAEFSSRRIDMFVQQSNEIAEYPFWPIREPERSRFCRDDEATRSAVDYEIEHRGAWRVLAATVLLRRIHTLCVCKLCTCAWKDQSASNVE
jgi:hypothetical protein